MDGQAHCVVPCHIVYTIHWSLNLHSIVFPRRRWPLMQTRVTWKISDFLHSLMLHQFDCQKNKTNRTLLEHPYVAVRFTLHSIDVTINALTTIMCFVAGRWMTCQSVVVKLNDSRRLLLRFFNIVVAHNWCSCIQLWVRVTLRTELKCKVITGKIEQNKIWKCVF